ncbi:hypothetical protein HanHA300_Chr03g0102851 [Helianthus annuus]|nr:hypothetical protein HanHA300_Chr03g0102851 [Helianthus annuus]KAJ0608947.1 hypothetical protein HanHA89_Chr03g0114531 [Helianthus annuus]KAJ0944729.1 hypothetical protein HanPSC8_Chr03g0120071 [Helianthus annuus]
MQPWSKKHDWNLKLLSSINGVGESHETITNDTSNRILKPGYNIKKTIKEIGCKVGHDFTHDFNSFGTVLCCRTEPIRNRFVPQTRSLLEPTGVHELLMVSVGVDEGYIEAHMVQEPG